MQRTIRFKDLVSGDTEVQTGEVTITWGAAVGLVWVVSDNDAVLTDATHFEVE